MYGPETNNSLNSQKLAAAQSYLGGAISAGAPKIGTQYEQLCERVTKRLEGCNNEIGMLRETLSAVMPQEPTAVGNETTPASPPEHSAPMMKFLRHVEQRLESMQMQVEYIRVRTPF